MAQSSYRSWIGVAKDTDNASLQIAHASGATTLTLRNIVQTSTHLTGSGATYDAIIVDGTLTEKVSCSGNVSGTTDGSTIACGALANSHSANAYVYFQLHASFGPTAYIPVTALDFSDAYEQLYDSAYRGSNVKNYGAYQGVRTGDITLGGDVFADTFGYLLSSLFGSYDYTATSGGNPTTYAFAANNILTNGRYLGQPTDYLIYQYNPANSNIRVYARSHVEELGIKVDPGALVSWTSKISAQASGVVTITGSVPPSFSAVKPIPSYNATVSIGGTATPKVESYEVTFKREEFEQIQTLMGIQDPLDPFVGPLTAAVKSTLVIDDDTQLNNYINESQPSFTLTCTQGATSAANGIKIQCTKANYDKGTKVVQTGKAHVRLEVPFVPLANSTDANTAGGGLSPALVTLSTGTTTGATLY